MIYRDLKWVGALPIGQQTVYLCGEGSITVERRLAPDPPFALGRAVRLGDAWAVQLFQTVDTEIGPGPGDPVAEVAVEGALEHVGDYREGCPGIGVRLPGRADLALVPLVREDVARLAPHLFTRVRLRIEALGTEPVFTRADRDAFVEMVQAVFDEVPGGHTVDDLRRLLADRGLTREACETRDVEPFVVRAADLGEDPAEACRVILTAGQAPGRWVVVVDGDEALTEATARMRVAVLPPREVTDDA